MTLKRCMIFLVVVQFTFSQTNLATSPIYICPPCNSVCDSLTFENPGSCEHCNTSLIHKKELETFKNSRNKTIAFYLQDGVEVLDFAGPMEVFSYAGFQVFTVSKSKETITSQGVLNIIPDYAIADAPKADILAFFGGNVSKAYQDIEVIDWVKKQENIEYYFSVCTGAFILAEAGILQNKTATTFHSALNEFEKKYPKTKVLKDVRYVDNGKVITTAGISAGIDGALHLVAKIQGFNNARKVAYNIEYDKWTPGEGLLLTNDNPYSHYMEIKNLEDYIGRYQFENNGQVEIELNQRENSIYAILDGQKYPLFYLNPDIFVGVNGQHVSFQRNKNNIITGYRSSEADSILYKKL
ncbi:DJ-1/PfpI family protein [Maribacter antarcticus]|uniref:DJ-1/PfpI family protein n=1 Tax=Maribacter antarcticus TaxID=505250 RepID=UPI0006847090|nr:DJ-1/PfpI family protein [Maribacter antarcticus]